MMYTFLRGNPTFKLQTAVLLYICILASRKILYEDYEFRFGSPPLFLASPLP